MGTDVLVGAVPGKRSFPLGPPRKVESVTIHFETPKLEKSRSVRRIRCARSSISLVRRANGREEDPFFSRTETPPPLPTALPSTQRPAPPAVPLRLDSAFGETFGIEAGSLKRVRLSTTSTRISITSERTLSTVVEKQILQLPEQGAEVAPKAPLFDLEMFGNGQVSPSQSRVSSALDRRASLAQIMSPPASPSLYDHYLDLDDSASERPNSSSSSATETSLDDLAAPNEVHYSFSETPDTSPEIAEFQESFVKIEDSPQLGIDPDAAWLFGQADEYRRTLATANSETLPTVKSEPQLHLPTQTASPPAQVDAIRSKTEPFPPRSSSMMGMASVIKFERTRMGSWSSDSSDGLSITEEGTGGLTPAHYRSPGVLSRRTSTDYFNLPLRPSPSPSARSSGPNTPQRRSSPRPQTPPVEGVNRSSTHATPERQHSLRADVLSRQLMGLTTPPSTPEQRRISSSLRYVLPMLEDAVAGFPASMLSIESPIYNYIAPNPTDRETHLPVFHDIFPSTSDFLRSSIYMHLLAIDFLDSLPSPICTGVMDMGIDPAVYPCPLLTTPRSRVGLPTDFPSRIGDVRLKLRECLTRLFDASTGGSGSLSSAAKSGRLLASLLSMIRAMKNNDAIPSSNASSGAIFFGADNDNSPIDLLGPAVMTSSL